MLRGPNLEPPGLSGWRRILMSRIHWGPNRGWRFPRSHRKMECSIPHCPKKGEQISDQSRDIRNISPN